MPRGESIRSSGYLGGLLSDGSKPFRWRAGVWRLLGAVPEGLAEVTLPFRFPGYAFRHRDQAEIRSGVVGGGSPARRPDAAAPGPDGDPGPGRDPANEEGRPPAGAIPNGSPRTSSVPGLPAASERFGSAGSPGMDTVDRNAGMRAPVSDLAIPGASPRPSFAAVSSTAPAGNNPFPGRRRSETAPGDSDPGPNPQGREHRAGNAAAPILSRLGSGRTAPAAEGRPAVDTGTAALPAAGLEPPSFRSNAPDPGRLRLSAGTPSKPGAGSRVQETGAGSMERVAARESAPRGQAAALVPSAPPSRASAGGAARAGIPTPDALLRLPYRNAPAGRSAASGIRGDEPEGPEPPRQARPAKADAPSKPALIAVPVQAGTRAAATRAFWERSYLGRLHFGRIR